MCFAVRVCDVYRVLLLVWLGVTGFADVDWYAGLLAWLESDGWLAWLGGVEAGVDAVCGCVVAGVGDSDVVGKGLAAAHAKICFCGLCCEAAVVTVEVDRNV